MSFDLVPVDVVLKIFHQLPFKDRVHLGGVNRLFRDISMESINKMKSLSLNYAGDLIAYSVRSTQSFTSLLESCSSTLESIDASNFMCSKLLINSLVEFIYPNLKHLKISILPGSICKGQQPKKLLSRSPNLRSIVLDLWDAFEWPKDFVFENLEDLEIRDSCSKDINQQEALLRPLIGNVPRLKRLAITCEERTFTMQEFSHLLSSTPCLRELNLELSNSGYYDDDILAGPFAKICGDFVIAIPTWRLPMLTTLKITLDDKQYLMKNFLIPSSILHNFPTSFPRLKSFTSKMIKEIDDQSIVAFSQLVYLRELRLTNLKMTKEKFSELITSIPAIEILDIFSPPKDALLDLSHLVHLRELHLHDDLSKNELIDLITNVPSISILHIWRISNVDSSEIFIGFLTSTTSLFHRPLEIRLSISTCDWTTNWMDESDNTKMEQLKVSLEEVKNSGGPEVEMNDKYIESIRYRSMVG